MDIITNKDIIALNQSMFVYQAQRLVDYGDLKVWTKPLISTMSGEVAIALLNRSKTEQNITFNLESIGIDTAKGYTIKYFWSKERHSSHPLKKINPYSCSSWFVVLKIKGKTTPFNVFQYKNKK